MTISEKNGLTYFHFKSFDEAGLTNGVFSRRGGISPMPWASLNLGGGIGDTRENIIENRKRIFDAINRPVESIFDVWQVHGTKIIATDQPRPLNVVHEKADGILTNNPNITLLMRFADCTPIFLADPKKRVVSIVHAGWKGTVNQIAVEAIRKMDELFGCRRSDVLAGIGPSIGMEDYEVGEDVWLAAKQNLFEEVDKLFVKINGKLHFDLWEANRIQLEKEGVQQIEVAGISTAANTTEWYSHRAENGKTGRFGAVLALENGRI